MVVAGLEGLAFQNRFGYLSPLIFQLALMTLSMCHQAAGLADVTSARHRPLPLPGF